MEGVGVPGPEFTYFGAPGVQRAKPVPSSTNRSALHWAALAETQSLCLTRAVSLNAKQKRCGRLCLCLSPATAQKHGLECPKLPESAHQLSQRFSADTFAGVPGTPEHLCPL